MTLFCLVLSVLINVALVGFLLWMWGEKEFWRKRYQDQIKELCPIKWDYTKEGGWQTDEN